MDSIIHGGNWKNFSVSLGGPEFLDALVGRLAPRDGQVLRLVCSGHSNREIAELLGVKTRVVKQSVTHILRQLSEITPGRDVV